MPLQRSVDTVSGLLSFPVEVALLGDGAVPWARREQRALPLPRLDAPVAVTRVTLHLPPGYRSRLQPGDGEVVAAFTRGDGIHYGMGVGEVGAAEADALFQSAVKGWLGNNFDSAQADLDRLRALGAKNENIERLQGNLDLIAGKDKGGKANASKQDESVNRRIREQARARAAADQVAQQELQAQADNSRKSGDYKAAESQYRQALAVGDRLAKLEQRESVEQSSVNAALLDELESTKKEAQAVAQVQVAGKKGRGRKFKAKSGFGRSLVTKSDSGAAAPAKSSAVYDFSDDELAAEANADGDGLDDAERWRPSGGAEEKSVGDLEKPAPEKPMDASLTPVVADPTPSTTPAQDIPVGGTARDFTAVIDVVPAAREDTGVRVAGSSGGEAVYQVDGVATADTGAVGGQSAASPEPPAPIVAETMAISVDSLQPAYGVARGGLLSRVRRAAVDRRARRSESRASNAPKAPGGAAASPAEREADKPAAPEGMPQPKVTASALSVVVPAVGQAVLYQRLLLPADAAYAVDVSAREPLISRD